MKCPLLESYNFESTCNVKKCKYYTPRTAHHCLHIDTRLSEDGASLSDAELLYYKYPDHPEYTVKRVAAIRKRVMRRVENYTLLYYAVVALDARPVVAQAEFSDTILKVLERKPFRLPLFNHFRPYHFAYLIEDANVRLQETLNMSDERYSRFKKTIKRCFPLGEKQHVKFPQRKSIPSDPVRSRANKRLSPVRIEQTER